MYQMSKKKLGKVTETMEAYMQYLSANGANDQSINQSNIRLLTRRITRLTQTQAGFTEELGVGKMNN